MGCRLLELFKLLYNLQNKATLNLSFMEFTSNSYYTHIRVLISLSSVICKMIFHAIVEEDNNIMYKHAKHKKRLFNIMNHAGNITSEERTSELLSISCWVLK